MEMRFLLGVRCYLRRDHVRNVSLYDECVIGKPFVKTVGVEQMSNERFLKLCMMKM